MRKLLILFVFAAITLSSCKQATNQNPAGLTIEEMTDILTSQKWRYDVDQVQKGLDEVKSKIPPGQYEIVSKAIQRVQFGTFEFTKDNTIWLDLANGSSPSQGTWVFSPEGDYLVITFSTTKAVPHPIEKFSKDEIYLGANLEAGAIYPKVFIPLSEGSGIITRDTVDTTNTSEQ
ncbi:MAG: hypothetical protein KDC85_16270 [Saprospiraceae bacterium]|nr:hypothetical protein [Saprospiraceae bacterium]MCB9326170.1 hypothetical protein [Lewinellaceae bacterium]